MARCDCSIVILAHNGADFTSKCVQSLLDAADLPHEVFLVDNGSTDSTPELIQSFAPAFDRAGVTLTSWRNEENKGCSAARNDAWARADTEYVVLLDNDTAVCTRNWLSRLQGILAGDAKLGLLGPKLIYPYLPHPIQCAGVSISRLGRIAFCGRGSPRTDPAYAHARAVPALISACWIMRTALRDTVGMLDELFHPVQYEDLDLCMRAVQAGYGVAYTPEVEMYHFEGITTASLGQAEYQRNIARNSARFRERWRHVFAARPDELPAEEYRWLPRDELGLTPELDLAYCDSAPNHPAAAG